MLSRSTLRIFTNSKTNRVPIKTVKRLMMIPKLSVVAKPRIGPVPKIKRMSAVMSVVTCESQIVVSARWYPASMAARATLPRRSSSRMRSNIKTFESTPTPMSKINPAMPGRVSVAFRPANTPMTTKRLSSWVKTATKPLRR
jgi:hypothetical protein